MFVFSSDAVKLLIFYDDFKLIGTTVLLLYFKCILQLVLLLFLLG